jgi:hypothetical protein
LSFITKFLTFQGGKGNRGGNEDIESRSLTGIAWHRDKFVGTPLELDDERLKAHAEWLKKHDVTIVKIDSAERHEAEDVYVSDKVISRFPQPPPPPLCPSDFLEPPA